MATQHEIQAEQDAAEWLATLPLKVRTNTVATETLKHHWITNSPKQLAAVLADCIKQQAWDGVAYMPAVASKREVRHYSPMQWLRECIGAEPDELMRLLAGQQLTKEETAPAAKGLVLLLKEHEAATLRSLCADYQTESGTMVGWETLIKQCGWGEVLLELHSEVKNKPGGNGSNQHTKSNATRCVAKQEDPTLGAGRQPKDRKSRLIRTLTNLKDNPDTCKERGTTPEKVENALNRLVRGLTPSVEAAKREAGLAEKKPNAGLGIRGNPDDVATRLIRTVGAAHAKAIAEAILNQLGDG